MCVCGKVNLIECVRAYYNKKSNRHKERCLCETHAHKDIADMLVKDIKIQLVNFICLQKPQRCVEGGVGLIKFHK